MIPTPYGEFQTRVFETAAGDVYLAMVRGSLDGDGPVLTRLHSECLTSDALGSLRCDCGVQLRTALRAVMVEGRGIVLYMTGHEGRGIGLVNKLRAYMEQDRGADTVDANLRLGLPADSRDYTDAGAVLTMLDVRSVRLLSNNPRKADGLRRAGVRVDAMVPLPSAAHVRNARYLRTKAVRLGHVRPSGSELTTQPATPVDVSTLLGEVRSLPDRPYVLLKYAQTLDGRIATRSGDSKWISGEPERRVSHALRAACDAVLVGAGTVRQDDPQLTVRLVPGATPLRVVLSSRLGVPQTAKVFSEEAPTMIFTTANADSQRRAELLAAGVAVSDVAAAPGGVDLAAALAQLHQAGVRSLMVEGGAGVITSLLASRLVDRLVVSVSPVIVGSGVEAVRELGVERITDGLRLSNRSVNVIGEDVLLSWDLHPAR
ncbi:MAG: bifunctional diaminohydroxyphosphoribosylaminopyrimidine deaminase/5-amino-6-(5-phosphoribosylamino)uracil reductase RibD [Pseudonocardiaceae bacterium]